MFRPARAALLLAVVAALLVSVSGCSAAAGSSPPSPTPSPPRPSSPGLTSVTPAAALPSEPTAQTSREARSPDPAFDYGFVVQITPSGFHPAVLVSACCAPVVWINLTNKPNSVVFDVEAGHSGLIPPGASWSFTPPNAESIAYHSGVYASMTGAVQVNQTTE